jgi:hypothetical protein
MTPAFVEVSRKVTIDDGETADGIDFELIVTLPLITPAFLGCAIGGAIDCADNVEAAAGSSSIKPNVTRYFIDLFETLPSTAEDQH